MSTRAAKIIAYCIGVASEFQARLSRMQAFVKHNLSTGTANEVILRDFLSNHSPANFHVGQGFMCDPFEEGKVSRQCDILIYNQNDYPLVYADGAVKVVWPEATRMVIEVKTNFDKQDIAAAIENIAMATRLNRQVSGIIFAFQSPRLQTVMRHLREFPQTIEDKHKPLAILLLDKGAIIHRWSWSRRNDMEAVPGTDASAYGVRVGKKGDNAVVIAFLLLLFFQILGERGLYGADAINTAMEMLEIYTDRHEDVLLGG